VSASHPCFFGYRPDHRPTVPRLLHESRSFQIDSTPKLLLSAGKMVDAIISSGVGHYLEFKSVESLFYVASKSASKKVPPLPQEYADDPNRLARVHECQSPFFLAVNVGDDGRVQLFFDCPPETPTVRGFAGIIREALEGEHYSVVLEVPTTFYSSMGLEEVVSPMRLRGMRAIMAAIRRGIRKEIGGNGEGEV
jgi:cysteine desulfuration protein SufE